MNAFNLVNRSALLNQVRLKFPDIYEWVSYCYASDNPHLWVGELSIRSVTGFSKVIRWGHYCSVSRYNMRY